MEKKLFWGLFLILSLIADFAFSLVWSLILTVPILVLSWWIAYRSNWFDQGIALDTNVPSGQQE
jgi:hypothetical protein